MKVVLQSAWKSILPQKVADSVYEQKNPHIFAQLLKNVRINGMEKTDALLIKTILITHRRLFHVSSNTLNKTYFMKCSQISRKFGSSLLIAQQQKPEFYVYSITRGSGIL